MANYELIVRNTDTGTDHSVATDSVAEGEIDEWTITIENPQIVASGSQTSGN